jgi:hypothetical protein
MKYLTVCLLILTACGSKQHARVNLNLNQTIEIGIENTSAGPVYDTLFRKDNGLQLDHTNGELVWASGNGTVPYESTNASLPYSTLIVDVSGVGVVCYSTVDSFLPADLIANPNCQKDGVANPQGYQQCTCK